ncbi:19140_t:CDS:2, partial [Funneliformis geosporum]
PNTNDYLLIMKYANNGNLHNYLKNNFNNLNWDDKQKLGFQIAKGLNYLYNENVLHRDLVNFGISKIGNNSTIHIGLCGKTAYIEPQILINHNFQYIKPSDIYSYGVLMWEISSGYPPFKDLNDATICALINNKAQPIRRPTITEILEEYSQMSYTNESIKENNAKITDFGISKIENNSTLHIVRFGKTAYMEPQILADQNFQYIKASDIYSFGVLMWEISSGHPPFEDKFNNNQDLIVAITCYKARETTIPDTPEDYETLYKIYIITKNMTENIVDINSTSDTQISDSVPTDICADLS